MNTRNEARREPGFCGRSSPRVNSLREISISYEGHDEKIVIKPPNLSKRGMFINTSRNFPEGAVLNLHFSLLLTNADIHTRGEVRYCRTGVGIGVEFIGLTPEDERLIERELARNHPKPARRVKQVRAKRTVARSRSRRRY